MSALGDHPTPKRVKSGHCCLKKHVNRNKCVFATKQRMFGVLAIVEIQNDHNDYKYYNDHDDHDDHGDHDDHVGKDDLEGN